MRRIVFSYLEGIFFMHSDVCFMIAQLEREELLKNKKHMYWRHPNYQMGKRSPGLVRRLWKAMIAALSGPPSKGTMIRTPARRINRPQQLDSIPAQP